MQTIAIQIKVLMNLLSSRRTKAPPRDPLAGMESSGAERRVVMPLPVPSPPVYDRESHDRAWTERESISMLVVNATGKRSAAEARCTDPPAARTARMVSGNFRA